METDSCDVNHLESDVLLPPRKRLLAGFKKQNSNGNESPSPPLAVASSSSTKNSYGASSNVQVHLDKLLTSHLNDPNLTPEEVAEASRLAAAAAEAAKAARAAADEKAAIAAKAVAEARNALELVASFPEESTVCKERSPKKNKLKKHVPVELLYTKDQPRESCGVTDEDLACRLHRALNSSPRVLRTCSSSETRGHKHKKQKAIVTSENPRFSSGSSIVSGSMCNGHEIAGLVDSDSSYDGIDKRKTEEKMRVSERASRLESDNLEAESSRLKDKIGEESTSSGKRRGRVKLKKLPLSICTSRDQENHKEEPSPLPEKTPGGVRNGSKPLIHSEGPSEGLVGVMSGPSWKCQDLKAPECVKQNKAVRS